MTPKRKSPTCRGKIGDRPLTEYDEEWEAKEAAHEFGLDTRQEMVHYRCPKCDRWHIAPKSRQTPSKDCISCDKQSYPTKKDAERRSRITKSERGIRLRVYKCPHGNGYHTTRT